MERMWFIMCAIAGILDLQAEPAVLEKMLETMARRGPDDRGTFQESGCTLLHTRLAVIDPEGGRQPMTLSWAGETYTLVYNGELYNTRQLRTELKGLGHQFTGHSDTEVVLHGYAQWGEDCVHRFNGIFALAVWESKRQRLFLARDRIGVKPLFCSLHQGGLLFASEMKTILAYPTVKARLDETGAMELILLGPGRLPGSGVFRDIREVEPGCMGYYERGNLQLVRYWQLRDREHRDSLPDTIDSVRTLVMDEIKGMGVNNRVQLAEAMTQRRKIINHRHMLSGVTLIDPENTYIDADVILEQDVTVYPGNVLLGKTYVEKDSVLYNGNLLSNVRIPAGSSIGPGKAMEAKTE